MKIKQLILTIFFFVALFTGVFLISNASCGLKCKLNVYGISA
ncbi:MAG: hypothetical protein V1835_05540 [Candidatus Micrarchaeota archaeon]